MAIDSAGNVWTVGYTSSADFPIQGGFDPDSNGGEDGFVTKWSPEGQLVWSSYLGGSGNDQANGIAVDDGGNVFVSVNGTESLLLMWNEDTGDSYEIIATLDSSQWFGWFGALAVDGDFLNGGSLYMTNYGAAGLAEITANVPEPATLCLLAGGAAGTVILLSALFTLLRKRPEDEPEPATHRVQRSAEVNVKPKSPLVGEDGMEPSPTASTIEVEEVREGAVELGPLAARLRTSAETSSVPSRERNKTAPTITSNPATPIRTLRFAFPEENSLPR